MKHHLCCVLAFVIVVLFSLAPDLSAETRRLSNTTFRGQGSGDANIITGIDAAASIANTLIQSRAAVDIERTRAQAPYSYYGAYPRTGAYFYGRSTRVYIPTRPLRMTANNFPVAVVVPEPLPAGYLVTGGVRSPWSQVVIPVDSLPAGSSLFDPVTGREFLVPEKTGE